MTPKMNDKVCQQPAFQAIHHRYKDKLEVKCGGPHSSLEEPQDPSMAATSGYRGGQHLPTRTGWVGAPWEANHDKSWFHRHWIWLAFREKAAAAGGQGE
jgi:general stress protein YciG